MEQSGGHLGSSCFITSLHDRLIVQSDSSNVISWVSSCSARPWKLHFLLSEIEKLASSFQVALKHMERLANRMANYLAKQGVDKEVPFVANIM